MSRSIAQTSLTTGSYPISDGNQYQRASAFIRRVLALLHDGAIDAERARKELRRHPDLIQHLQEDYLETLIAAALQPTFNAPTHRI